MPDDLSPSDRRPKTTPDTTEKAGRKPTIFERWRSAFEFDPSKIFEKQFQQYLRTKQAWQPRKPEMLLPLYPQVDPQIERYRFAAQQLYNLQDKNGSLYSEWALGDEAFRDLPMSQIPMTKLGYNPTFWEDPYRVARYWTAYQGMKPGVPAPSWLSVPQLEAAYRYFQEANGYKPWYEWKFLNANDPARQFLQGMSLPPDELRFPEEVYYQPTPQEEREEMPVEWLADPTKNPNWDKLPWWNKVLTTMFASGSPLARIGSGAIIGAAGGAFGGALFGGGVGSVPGALGGAAFGTGFSLLDMLGEEAIKIAQEQGWEAAEEIITPFHKLTRTVMDAFNAAWEGVVKRPVGMLVQAGAHLTQPERYGPIDDMIGSWQAIAASWKASRITATVAPVGMMNIPQGIEDLLNGRTDLPYASPITGATVWQLGYPEPMPLMDISGVDPEDILSGANMVDALLWARRQIMAGAPSELVNQMVMQRYGISGQMRELFGAILLDPGIRVYGEATTKGLGILGEAVGNQALVRAADTVLSMPRGAKKGPITTLRLYETLLRTDTPVEIVSAGGRITRWLGGVERTGEVQTAPALGKAAIEIEPLLPRQPAAGEDIVIRNPETGYEFTAKAYEVETLSTKSQGLINKSGFRVAYMSDAQAQATPAPVSVDPNTRMIYVKPGAGADVVDYAIPHELAHVIGWEYDGQKRLAEEGSDQAIEEMVNAGMRLIDPEGKAEGPVNVQSHREGLRTRATRMDQPGGLTNEMYAEALGLYLRDPEGFRNDFPELARVFDSTVEGVKLFADPAEQVLSRWLDSPAERAKIRDENPELAAKLDKLYPKGIKPGSKWAAGRVVNLEPKNGLLARIFSLTPRSRAVEIMGVMADTMKVLMDQRADPTDVAAAMRRLESMPTLAAEDLSLRFIGTPEGQYLIHALKDFDFEFLRNHEVVWESSQVQRSILNLVAELRGQKPYEVLRAIADPDQAGPYFKGLMDEVGLRAKEGDAVAIQIAEAAQKGIFTEDALKDMFTLFTEKGVPYHPEQWKAMLFDAWMQHVAKWTINKLGVKVEPLVWRLSDLLKSAQSLLLLDINPNYAIQNGVNNIGTMVVDGSFKMKNIRNALQWWESFGVFPFKLRQAFGGPSELGDIQMRMERLVSDEMGFMSQAYASERDATVAVADAAAGKGGIRTAQDWLGNIRRKVGVASRFSAKMEEWSSVQATTAGAQQMWSTLWRPGKGYRRMPPVLEQVLGSELSKAIYGIVDGSLNMKQIEDAFVEGQQLSRTVEYHINDIAQSLGMEPEQVSMVMQQSGALEFLKVRLPEAKTPADVRGIFALMRQHVAAHLDELMVGENVTRMMNIAAQIKSGDWLSFVDAWDAMNRQFDDWWTGHILRWNDAMDQVSKVEDQAARNQLVSVRMAEANMESARMNQIQISTVDGIGKGLRDLGVGFPEGYTDLFRSQLDGTKEFITLRDTEWRTFWKKVQTKELKFGSPEFKAEYVRISQELDNSYGRLALETMHLQEEMDNAIVRMIADSDETIADQVAILLEDVREHRAVQMAREQNIRRAMTEIRVNVKLTGKQVASILRKHFKATDPEFLKAIEPWLKELDGRGSIEAYEINNRLYKEYTENLKIPSIAEQANIRSKGIQDVVEPIRVATEKVAVDVTRVQELIDQGVPKDEAIRQVLGEGEPGPQQMQLPKAIVDLTAEDLAGKPPDEIKQVLDRIFGTEQEITKYENRPIPSEELQRKFDLYNKYRANLERAAAAQDTETVGLLLDEVRGELAKPVEIEIDLDNLRQFASEAGIATATDDGRPMDGYLINWINKHLGLRDAGQPLRRLDDLGKQEYQRAVQALDELRDWNDNLQKIADERGMTFEALKFLEDGRASLPRLKKIAVQNGLPEIAADLFTKQMLHDYLIAKREGVPYRGPADRLMTLDQAVDVLRQMTTGHIEGEQQLNDILTIWEGIAKSHGMTLEEFVLRKLASDDPGIAQALYQVQGVKHPWVQEMIKVVGLTENDADALFLLRDGTKVGRAGWPYHEMATKSLGTTPDDFMAQTGSARLEMLNPRLVQVQVYGPLSAEQMAAIIEMGKSRDAIYLDLSRCNDGWYSHVDSLVADARDIESISEMFAKVDDAYPKSLYQIASAKTVDHPWVQKGIEIFGKTEDPAEAGFMLRDGTMLDFSGKAEGGMPGMRSYDHRDIWQAMDEIEVTSFRYEEVHAGGTDGLMSFLRETGSIRMFYSKGRLMVEVHGPMSIEQMIAINNIAMQNKANVYAELIDPKTLRTIYYDEVGPDIQQLSALWNEFDRKTSSTLYQQSQDMMGRVILEETVRKQLRLSLPEEKTIDHPWTQKALERYGTEQDLTKAGYILRDGSLLPYGDIAAEIVPDGLTKADPNMEFCGQTGNALVRLEGDQLTIVTYELLSREQKANIERLVFDPKYGIKTVSIERRNSRYLSGWGHGVTIFSRSISNPTDKKIGDLFASLDQTGPAILYQEGLAPTFYSLLGQTVEKKMQPVMPAEDMLNWIQKQGIKGDELEWSGLRSFLEDRAAKGETVTKDEVQQLLNDNWVELEPVMYPTEKWVQDPRIEPLSPNVKWEVLPWARGQGEEAGRWGAYEPPREVALYWVPKGNIEALNERFYNPQEWVRVDDQEFLRPADQLETGAFVRIVSRPGEKIDPSHPLGSADFRVMGVRGREGTQWTKNPMYALSKYQEAVANYAWETVAYTITHDLRQTVATSWDTYQLRGRASEFLGDFKSLEDAQHAAMTGERLVRQDPRYEGYKLPGGEYYEEHLLTLPKLRGPDGETFESGHWHDVTNPMSHTRTTQRVDDQGNNVYFIEELQSDWHQKGRETGYIVPVDEAAVLEADRALWQAENRLSDLGLGMPRYVRYGEDAGRYIFVDGQGNRILPYHILHEPNLPPHLRYKIQSRYGPVASFDTLENLNLFLDKVASLQALAEGRLNAAQRAIDEMIDPLNRYITVNGNVIGRLQSADDRGGAIRYNREYDILRLTQLTDEQFKALDDWMLRDREYTLANSVSQSGVPDVPWKKDWHEVSMRYMLRQAAERGRDKIAWTTAKTQVERWSLGNWFDRVEWERHQYLTDVGGRAEDARSVQIIGYKNGRQAYDVTVREGDVASYLGTDMAKAIQESKEPRGYFEGDDLYVGKQGMQFFYDEAIPRYMRKYGKQWGVEPYLGKVETGRKYQPAYLLQTTGPGVYGYHTHAIFSSKGAAVDYAAENLEGVAWQVVPDKNVDWDYRQLANGDWGLIAYVEEDEWYVADQQHLHLGEIDDLLETLREMEYEYEDAWMMDIPPEMKRSVLYDGQRLFQMPYLDGLRQQRALAMQSLREMGLTQVAIEAILQTRKLEGLEPEARAIALEVISTNDAIRYHEKTGQPYTFGDHVNWLRKQYGGKFDVRVEMEGARLPMFGEQQVWKVMDSKSRVVIATFTDETLANMAAQVIQEGGIAQEGAIAPKGAVSFLDDGRAILRALENPDVSTALHETGHIFRKMMVRSDQEIALKWYEEEYQGDVTLLDDGQVIGPDAEHYEEMFGRAWERYFAEGVAPTPELEGLFARMKRWLLEIYHKIVGSDIDVKLTDEMRDLFARNLAGEEYKTRPKSAPADEPAAPQQVSIGGKVVTQPLTLERWLWDRKAAVDAAGKIEDPAERIAAIEQALASSDALKQEEGWLASDAIAQDLIARAKAEIRVKDFGSEWAADTYGVDPYEVLRKHLNNETLSHWELELWSDMLKWLEKNEPELREQIKVKTTEAGSPLASEKATKAEVEQMIRLWIDAHKKQVGPGIAGAGTAAHGADPTKSYEFRYRVVELDDLIPSHKLTGENNPDYPSAYQPRKRDRVASRQQIIRIASELEPNALLYHSQRIDDGTPIIGPDMLVESGNGRILGLKMAYDDYYVNYSAYRRKLLDLVANNEEYGLTGMVNQIGEMEKPVLVRERVTDVDREAFVRDANESATAAMSFSENAASDAQMVSLGSLTALEIGETQSMEQALRSPRNRSFTQGFISMLPQNEQGIMLDADGQLSRVGMQRIVAALFAKTFGGEAGDRLVQLAYESVDVNVKRAISGIEGALPELARAEALIEAGRRPQELSIGEDLAVAITKLDHLRTEGMKISDYMAQLNMFGAELTDFQKVLLEFVAEAKSAKQIREPLLEFGRLVQKQPDVDQMGMFGQTEYPGKLELWEKALEGPQQQLFQMPPEANIGPIDGVPEPMYMGSTQQEGWENIQPVLSELERRMTGDEGWDRKYRSGELDDALGDMRPEFTHWLNDISSDMASTKHTAMRWGENVRDWALLNYQARRGFDAPMTALMPYFFWPSRTFLRWALRAIDRPSLFANYFRYNQVASQYQNTDNFPSRLRGKWRIPLPFLPEWMGGGVWVDPLRSWFPPAMFAENIHRIATERDRVAKSAQYIIEKWAAEGKVELADARAALQDQAGDLWDQAIEAAEQEQSLEYTGPMDYLGVLSSLSLPLNIAREFARGTPERIQPLPITRLVKGLTAPFGIGGAGGINLEAPLRKAVDMPVFDRFEEYRIERMVSNMIAEGEISPRDGEIAFLSHQGAAWDAAEQRVNQARFFGTYASPLFWIGFPGDSFPPSEAKLRALEVEWNRALDSYRQGDTGAFQRMLEEYPEYQSRLDLWKDPRERLRWFLVDEIWTKYMELNRADKEIVRLQLGQDFQEMFIDKPPDGEKRNYEAIPMETLAFWAQAIGGMLPPLPERNNGYEMPKIEKTEARVQLLPPELSQAVSDYREQRDEKFPNWYAVQQQYFALPKGKARKNWLENTHLGQFLKRYWDWQKGYFEDHPEVELYSQSFDLTDEEGNEIASWRVPEIISNPILMRQIMANQITGQPITSGALIELKRIWDQMGNPGADFEHFLLMIGYGSNAQ